MSWHGILLSETARLAPAGSAGAVTGGVLSFGQIGALLGPFSFSLLLRLTGGYGRRLGPVHHSRIVGRNQFVAPAHADRGCYRVGHDKTHTRIRGASHSKEMTMSKTTGPEGPVATPRPPAKHEGTHGPMA